MALVITSILFSIHSSLPNSADLSSQPQTLYGIDFSKIFTTFSLCINKLNNISPVVVVGALAIVALWFFDQLFSRALRH
jgi:hypothetical protein